MSIGAPKPILKRPTLPTEGLLDKFALFGINSNIATLSSSRASSRPTNSSITNLALTGTTKDSAKLKIKDPEPFRGNRSKFKIFSI